MKVQIVILNWNGTKDTIECLKSIFEFEQNLLRLIEILVIDNFSDDFMELKKFCDNRSIRFIRFSENYGFAIANNYGLLDAMASGVEYTWIINNDLVFEADCLKKMLKVLDENLDIGIMSPQFYFYDDRNIPTGTGGRFSPINPKLTMVDADISGVLIVDQFIGAAMLVRNSIIKEVGFIPIEYFMYREETDWIISIRQAGYKSVIHNKAIAYHKISSSSGHASPFQEYYMTRNTLILVSKHFKGYRLYYLVVYMLYRLIAIIVKQKNRPLKLLKASLRGYTDFISGKKGRNENI